MKDSFIEFFNKEKNKEYFKNLISRIEHEAESHNIYPSLENRYRALDFFEAKDTKLIILGQDPYYLKDMADGLAFSTQLNKCPKSLQNIIKEVKKDYPNSVVETFSLKSWAKQGVLLLNTALSVNENMPNSHQNFGWKTFNRNLIKFIFKLNNKVIFGLWGQYAYSFIKELQDEIYINKDNIIYTSHPSPLSYSKTKQSFKDSCFFKKVNSKLETKIDFSLRKD